MAESNWAISIGVNQYDYISDHLEYAVNDAEKVSHFLSTQLGFEVLLYTDTSKTLGKTQTRPSRNNLWYLLKNLIGQARRADNFLFFFSGHGALGKDLHEYLLTSDHSPSDVENTALPLSFVIQCLIECQARNTVLVLDMCRSRQPDWSKGDERVSMETLNQARRQGITVVFSCNRGERSYEIPSIQQGSFTYAFLEGLKFCVTTAELERYLMRRVSQINQENGKPPQHPLIGVESTLKYDLPLIVTQSRKLNQFQENIRSPAKSDRDIRSVELQSETNITLRESSHQFIIPAIEGKQAFEFEVIVVDVYGQKLKQHHGESIYLSEELGTSSLQMVVIPSGTFLMGSSERRPSSNELPLHSVTIKPFLMSKYPITKSQWKAVVKLEQVKIPLKLQPSRSGGAKHPIVEISWDEAVEFCDRLSRKTGHVYRLPSEAEWEFACRAGTTTPFHFGETITPDLANYDGTFTYQLEPKGENRKKAIDVGSFPFANAFGLFDMHGNVWEWCMDHWHENYNQAPATGEAWLDNGKNLSRVVRGGSWTSEAAKCRSTYRQISDTIHKSNNTGFRIVRNL
jgi:formylglycine-generating enzyme required for sulfatase activity